MNLKKYICPECGEKYPVTDWRYKCDCGSALDLEKEVTFPREKIMNRKPNLWRYREAIPIEKDKHIISFGEGMTPLVNWRHDNLELLLKLDYLFPTGSFKDRGASVLFSFLKEIGVNHFIEDSSGNAAAAAAAYAARGGLECEIFCPDYTSSGKIAQVELFGARLNLIKGTREDTARAILNKAGNHYYASHNWNPFFMEGLKTVAFEIAEQLGWMPPDNVICPLGYGGLFLGLYTGFKEMKEQGIITKIPSLLGVQSEACAPVYRAIQKRASVIEKCRQTNATLAEGICAALPIRPRKILQALEETDGTVTSVSEKEIMDGIKILAGNGLFVEPTSAAVVGAISHFRREKRINPGDKTVVILTGTGLKTLKEITVPRSE
ncbi:MAG: threonine synthase [Calditrichia bacterium]